MARCEESTFDVTFELLKIMPVWVGPGLAVLVFLVLHFGAPMFLPKGQGTEVAAMLWRPLLLVLSWVCGAAILVAWGTAEVWKLGNRRLLDSGSDVASLREIAWREFERLVSEAYRRRGYLAEVVGSDSGDGGVDIRLTGHGETVLVQCKQWRAYKVGVPTIRELLGVVVSERADRGIVVTSGRFTQEARAFGRQNPRIELVDGAALAELVRGVQVGAAPLSRQPAGPGAMMPNCPVCGSVMVLRTARKGQKAGRSSGGAPSIRHAKESGRQRPRHRLRDGEAYDEHGTG